MNEGLLSITRLLASAARQAQKNILPIWAFPDSVFYLSATERKSRVVTIVPKAAGRRTEKTTLPLCPNKCLEYSRCTRHLSEENSAGQRNSLVFVYIVISGYRGLPFLRHPLLFVSGLDGLELVIGNYLLLPEQYSGDGAGLLTGTGYERESGSDLELSRGCPD
jgi:hypothetical protein